MTEHKTIYEWACDYSGDASSHEARGMLARDFLVELGMTSDSNVLELGCGALSAGRWLIDYLAPDRYFGIEPAGWQVEIALKQKDIKPLTVKRPRFSWRDDFDAQEWRVQFDYVFAHSILSHCASWQWPLLLSTCRRVMAPNSRMLLSFRLGDSDSNLSQWAYPGVAYFSWKTIEETAATNFFKAELRPDLTERMVAVAPADFHDWVLLSREPRRWQEFVPFSDDELRLAYSVDASYDRGRLLAAGAGRMMERSD